jgi:uncharacterized protein YndB with AHSA1/START domain
MNPITVTTTIHAPLQKVWEMWTSPDHIKAWCHASDDWTVGNVENNVYVGGRFLTNMRAVDGSMSFDFTGTYTEVLAQEKIVYLMDKAPEEERNRECIVIIKAISPSETSMTESFTPESTNPIEMQKAGWQAILTNFKNYTEAN